MVHVDLLTGHGGVVALQLAARILQADRELVRDQVFDAEAIVPAIEVFIGRLRKKIGSDRIETVRGLGYRLAPLTGESEASSPP